MINNNLIVLDACAKLGIDHGDATAVELSKGERHKLFTKLISEIIKVGEKNNWGHIKVDKIKKKNWFKRAFSKLIQYFRHKPKFEERKSKGDLKTEPKVIAKRDSILVPETDVKLTFKRDSIASSARDSIHLQKRKSMAHSTAAIKSIISSKDSLDDLNNDSKAAPKGSVLNNMNENSDKTKNPSIILETSIKSRKVSFL
jgi:hypothetical protein